MTKTKIFALATAARPIAFANPPVAALAGSTFWVCATPQQSDLTGTAYAALTWVQVKGVGSFTATGNKTNILSFMEWETDVLQKTKGITNAGDPILEVARISTDPGQIIMRSICLTKFNYAFKIIRGDLPTGIGASATTIYNRGIVNGPLRPNGKTEDFDLEMYDLALNQREIVVEPVVGT